MLDLVRLDARSLLVDLGLLAGRRVEHGGVGSRLLADANEVVQDRLLTELGDDLGSRRPALEAGRDHGLAERLEHPRDVHALAAGQRAAFDGAVAAPEPEARYRQRLVDCRVEGDGDDHRCIPRAHRVVRVRMMRRLHPSGLAPSPPPPANMTSCLPH